MSNQPPWPEPSEGDYAITNFKFQNGQSLPQLKMHYRTLGTLKKDSNGRTTNAVLIMHGTTGSGKDFFKKAFSGDLFNKGQLLDVNEYFIVLPDGIGHGGSSKPSTELRARFPRYGYNDMVRADYLLLTEHLGINHLRLVLGTSMGGMHSWIWATTYPDFMDAVFPLSSLPVQIAGRNRMMRKVAIDSVRHDPEFNNGNYTSNPRGLRTAISILAWQSSCPLKWQEMCPDKESADDFIDAYIELGMKNHDANDFAYAFDASWDYDPKPKLKNIRAPLTAVNFGDDMINPPELGILEAEIKNVPKGEAVVVPISDKTVGHGTQSVAEVWEQDLAKLLERSNTHVNASL